ncbi:hypothetical protein K0038_02572 [Pseudomonas syringae]|uniref:hypothetical protein n=1 Tax=Pseudomonas syringae TaxID=317 RepID=UPI001CAA2F0C|nr:hypothetical protein [Pseudomonas syringae]MCI3945530.1 hypothetical protein [Pseudomonas syringae]
MSAPKLSFGNALPFLALFGPIVYVSNATIELGRLDYFNAPSGFVQLTSFGFSSMFHNLIEIMVILAMNLLILFGAKYFQGSDRLGQIFLAFTFNCGIAAYFSLTPLGIWGFGAIFALGVIYGLARSPKIKLSTENASVGDVGNSSGIDDWKGYVRNVKLIVLFIVALLWTFILFVKVGMHSAANQSSYWVSGDEVVLGFYGDHALVGAKNDRVVGQTFKLVLTRDLKAGMTLLEVGPLVPASRWIKTRP